MDFDTLKENTLKEENLIQTTDKIYRFVNHQEKILTTGWPRKITTLLDNKNIIRFDAGTVKIMRKRYSEVFPEKSKI